MKRSAPSIPPPPTPPDFSLARGSSASRGAVRRAGAVPPSGQPAAYRSVNGGKTWQRTLHVDDDTGVSIRIVTFYDGDKDEMITRMDALYGWAALRPELAVRIGG